jgi:hypothetical protein
MGSSISMTKIFSGPLANIFELIDWIYTKIRVKSVIFPQVSFIQFLIKPGSVNDSHSMPNKQTFKEKFIMSGEFQNPKKSSIQSLN